MMACAITFLFLAKQNARKSTQTADSEKETPSGMKSK
jgi:hypothetical protein